MLNVAMNEEFGTILKQIIKKPKCRYFFSDERVSELSKNAYYAKNDANVNGEHLQIIELRDDEDKSLVFKFSSKKETITDVRINEGKVQGYELISIVLPDDKKIRPKLDSHELVIVM